MENPSENIENLLIKLMVLNSRINKLEKMANEIFHEVELAYQQQLKELSQKNDQAIQKISALQKGGDNEKITTQK